MNKVPDNKCKICEDYHGGFFVWSSDRRFNRLKLAELCDMNKYNAFNESFKVCIECVRKHGLLK